MVRMGMILPLLALAGLWWLLSGGAAASWLVGLPAVLAAAWTVRRLGTDAPGRISPVGLLRFLPFFFWESVRGGIDVARRVLAPRMRIAPGFTRYPLRLHGRQARLLFANTVSLLPGTLAADLQDDWLEVHALDTTADFGGELARLEAAIGRVFGEAT